jgi:hypothetical protein
MLKSAAVKYAFLAVAAVLIFGTAVAQRLDEYRMLPADHPAIGYRTTPADNPMETLRKQLGSGDVKLDFDSEFGYLPSVLEKLDIPASSQVLVFTKTSFQAPLIAPRLPRAIYHADGMSVGIVRLGEVVELAVQDRQLGAVFYSIDQIKSSRPQMIRRGAECLQCHQGPATSGVPGLLVSSVFPERSGRPIFEAGFTVTDHRSKFDKRWGGWYVSGTHGDQLHMGNIVVQDRADVGSVNLRDGANKTDLKPFLDIGAYLAPHSDIVSLMVLEHKTRMINLITRVGYEARMAFRKVDLDPDGSKSALNQLEAADRKQLDLAMEELLTYMLYDDELQLESPVEGASSYADDFQKRGERDSKGRSLRELDMQTRMFRYPCSFLIYSNGWDGLPESVKQHLYERLDEILSGKGNGERFARLSADDRTAIREILVDTKTDLAAAWR